MQAAFFMAHRIMTPYLLCQFSKPTLTNLVKEGFGEDFPDIFHKKQINYIFNYLHDLQAKSALLEFNYIDKDYLEDYSRYYVKRFNNDGHACTRLHFFTEEITHKDLDFVLEGKDNSKLVEIQNSYLGFIVVKPLPKTFIGKTCLKPYPSKDTESKKVLKRIYEVDLFGIGLSVESIAFQEQDKVVSACATTSIWSALHAITWKSVRDIPALSQITSNAINFIEGSSNGFPTKNLTNKQIMRALDVEKLRHHSEFIKDSDKKAFIDTIVCNIKSNLPLILGIEVYSINSDGFAKLLDGHAVTVLGYRAKDEDEFVLYLHDDRLGPYARATFVDRKYLEERGVASAEWGLTLQEKDEQGKFKEPHEILIPDSLIVPSPQKVRLSWTYANETCKHIVSEYGQYLRDANLNDGGKNPLSFELQLKEISKIRQEILCLTTKRGCDSSGDTTESNDVEHSSLRRDFLTGNYARFQWVGSFYWEGRHALDILFDATDIPQGNAVSGIYRADKELAKGILDVFAKGDLYKQFARSSNSQDNFFLAFLNALHAEPEGLMGYLDTQFGSLRAPSYLKPQELPEGQIGKNDSLKRFYGSTDSTLDVLFPEIVQNGESSCAIWAIAQDGALLIAREMDTKQGHPTLTGFKPARIAGELCNRDGRWILNSKSGRYSRDYKDQSTYLANALKKFEEIFPNSKIELE